MTEQLSVVIAQCPAEIEGSQARLLWLAQTLSANLNNSVDLIVLPELFQCGYHIGENVSSRAQASDGEFFTSISALAKQYNSAIIYGYAERHDDKTFNSAQCVDNTGASAGHHRKLILPPGFEADHFAPGECCEIFTLGSFNIAILICYDVEFPENLRYVALKGADLVVVPTALSSQWGVVSEKLVPTRAFENGVFLCYANYSGQENSLSFFGGSCIVSPTGEELARASDQPCLLTANLQLSDVKKAQTRLPYHTDRQRLPWVAL